MSVFGNGIHSELYVYIFKNLGIRDIRNLALTSKSNRDYILSWKPQSKIIDCIEYGFIKDRFSDIEWKILTRTMKFSEFVEYMHDHFMKKKD